MKDSVSDKHLNYTSIKDILRLTDKFQSKLSPGEDYVFGTCLIVVGLISVVGNGSILGVFYSRWRRLSPAEIFLVNLGIVDILLSIASYPAAMISSFYHKWVFGSTGCTIYAFVCYFLGVASIISLTAIAIIRFLKTCSPALGNRINCETSYKVITWVYFYSLFWACLPLTGFGSYEVEPFGLSCTLEWSGYGIPYCFAYQPKIELFLISMLLLKRTIRRESISVNRVHISMVSVFCVFLPILIIIYCYSKIIILVRKSDKLVRDKRIRRHNASISDAQLTWMSIVVTAGFMIAWLPYTFVSLWGTFTDELLLPINLTPIPVLLAKSSIAYNPLIYIFMTKRYREDFKGLFGFLGGSGQGDTRPSAERLRQAKKPLSYDITKGLNSRTTTTGASFATRIEEHPMEMLIVNETTQNELSHINEGIDSSYTDDETNQVESRA